MNHFEISGMVDYNSHNITRLDLDEMESLLMKLTYIQDAVWEFYATTLGVR